MLASSGIGHCRSQWLPLTVALIAFLLFNYVGDPINNMVGQDTTIEDREQLRQDLGLNDPFVVQFGRFVANASRAQIPRAAAVLICWPTMAPTVDS